VCFPFFTESAALVLSSMMVGDGLSAAGSYFRYLSGYREEFDETNAALPSKGWLEGVSTVGC
jgi:hypothetical protein